MTAKFKSTHEKFMKEWIEPPTEPPPNALLFTRYKIVRKEKGILLSMNTSGTGQHTVVYEPMKWVIAPVGGLLTFVNEETAHVFWLDMNTAQLNRPMYMQHEYQVWKCHCWNELELPVARFGKLHTGDPDMVSNDIIIDDTMRKVWSKDERWNLKTGAGFHHRVELTLWPMGTEAWQWVRLMSPVEEKYHIITAA